MATMDIIRFGHAAVLVEAAGARVLIDPGVFTSDAAFELTDLDAVVVTHQHPDHLDRDRIGSLVSANPQARLLADPETAESIAGWDATAPGASVTVGALTLTGVGSRHAEIVPQLPRVANVGVLVTAEGEPTLFHPGDTYEYRPNGVDILALPLSAPWTKVSETVEFVRAIAPRTAFPIHDCTVSEPGYGIYWMHVENHGGVPDLQRLGQTEALATR